MKFFVNVLLPLFVALFVCIVGICCFHTASAIFTTDILAIALGVYGFTNYVKAVKAER